MARKGALFAVVVALGAGVFGPSGKADGLGPGVSGSPEAIGAGGPITAVSPTAETAPVQSAKDAAGDIAVWVNPTAPAASLVIGTDRQGAALESYDLKGKRVQRLARPAGSVNDVDIRTGFSLGGGTVTLVGAGGRGMSFYRLDPAGRRLSDVGARRWVDVGAEAFCLYRSAVSGRFYAFAVAASGDVTQYELFDQGGFVDARAVRRWPLGERAGGCVADDASGRLFLSEARSGIWRYNAEPDASPVERRQVDRTGGGGHLAADVEGLAIVTQPGRRGFLLASSEGDSTFAVYRRGGDHAWLGQREVAGGTAADGCTDTDGIEARGGQPRPRLPGGDLHLPGRDQHHPRPGREPELQIRAAGADRRRRESPVMSPTKPERSEDIRRRRSPSEARNSFAGTVRMGAEGDATPSGGPSGGGAPRVLVAGLPRSGTTWVGEVLGRTAGARYLHEPDNHLVRPDAWLAKRRLGPYPELRPRRPRRRRLRAAVGPGLRRRPGPLAALRRPEAPPAGRCAQGERATGQPASLPAGARPAGGEVGALRPGPRMGRRPVPADRRGRGAPPVRRHLQLAETGLGRFPRL